MNCVFTVAGAVFFHIQFFASGFTAQDVVVSTAFGANEENGFRFFLACSHFKFSECSYQEVSPTDGP